MTYTEHQQQQARTLAARRTLDRAEMSAAQAARLARLTTTTNRKANR